MSLAPRGSILWTPNCGMASDTDALQWWTAHQCYHQSSALRRSRVTSDLLRWFLSVPRIVSGIHV